MTDIEPISSKRGMRSGQRLLQVALLILGTLLLWLFFSRYVVAGYLLSRVGVPFVFAVLVAVAALGIGAASRKVLDSRLDPAVPFRLHIPIDFTIGYPLFGSICYLIGWVSTGPMALLLPVVTGLVLCLWMIRLHPVSSESVELRLTPSSIVSLVLLSVAGGCSLVIALLPPFSLDELAYHLSIPKIWVAAGRIVDLPLMSHSYFPFAIEAADLPFLSVLGEVDGGMASHLLHLLSAASVVALIFGWLRRHSRDANQTILFVAGLVSTPALLVTTGWSGVEWPLLGCAAALMIAIHEYLSETDRTAAGGTAGTIALAVAGGLLIKYTFVAFLAAVLVGVIVSAPRRIGKREFLSVGVGALIGSFYFVRNLLLVGNPVAPFFDNSSIDVTAFRDPGGPLALFRDYVFTGAYLDETIGITLLLMCGGLLLARPSDERSRFVFVSGAGLLVVAIVIAAARPSSRILLPFLIGSALAGAMCMTSTPLPRIVRRAYAVIILVAATTQTLLVVNYTSSLEPWGVLAGLQSEEEYLRQNRASFETIEWMSARLPADARPLVLGIQELFWFPGDTRGGGNADGPRITAYLQTPDLMALLRRDGITHVCVIDRGLTTDESRLDRKKVERMTLLTPEALRALREVLRSAEPIATRPGAAVYRLLN